PASPFQSGRVPDQSWWDPATDGIPLTQGRRIPKRVATRKRKFGAGWRGFFNWRWTLKLGARRRRTAARISIPDRHATEGPEELSARAEVERFYVGAARQLPHPRHDLGAVMEKFVAHDGMRHEHGEAVALDLRGMRIGGVGRADDLRPMIADCMFRRFAADTMLLKELLNNRHQWLRRPGLRSNAASADCVIGFLRRRKSPQLTDEFVGEFAELMRLVGH